MDDLDSVTSPLSFNKFLELMNQDQARDLCKKVNSFLKDFRARAPNADVDSRHMQEFMMQMELAMSRHPLWAGSSPEELEAATEALEKYVMTKLFDRTFGRAAEDVERDALLTTRLLALQFVRPEHLEIGPDDLGSDPNTLLACKELNKINMFKTPRDKLVCVLNCCRVINNLLTIKVQGQGDSSIGADDFTPTLIFVVIKAQTGHLASNLAYIERYRMQSRLTSESQYYYIQLSSAATFIETLNASSLKVNQDEFLANMLQYGAMTEEQLAMTMMEADKQQQQQQQQQQQGGWTDRSAVGQAAATPNPGHSGTTTTAPPPPPPSLLPSRSPKTAAQLEAAGEQLLGRSESAAVLSKFTFLYADADDLTVRQVHQLLAEYKALALRYDMLVLAADNEAKLAAEAAVAPPPAVAKSALGPALRAAAAAAVASSPRMRGGGGAVAAWPSVSHPQPAPPIPVAPAATDDLFNGLQLAPHSGGTSFINPLATANQPQPSHPPAINGAAAARAPLPPLQQAPVRQHSTPVGIPGAHPARAPSPGLDDLLSLSVSPLISGFHPPTSSATAAADSGTNSTPPLAVQQDDSTTAPGRSAPPVHPSDENKEELEAVGSLLSPTSSGAPLAAAAGGQDTPSNNAQRSQLPAPVPDSSPAEGAASRPPPPPPPQQQQQQQQQPPGTDDLLCGDAAPVTSSGAPSEPIQASSAPSAAHSPPMPAATDNSVEQLLNDLLGEDVNGTTV